jgi:hypothetical protein
MGGQPEIAAAFESKTSCEAQARSKRQERDVFRRAVKDGKADLNTDYQNLCLSQWVCLPAGVPGNSATFMLFE